MSSPNAQPDDSGNTVSFRPTRTGVRVKATGPGSYAAAVECWRAIAVQVRERQSLTVLLIDETHGQPLRADEWQSLVDGMRGIGLEAVRIAHVRPFGLQGVEYCEIFAREAGFDARVFDNEATAELWLRYGSQAGRHGRT
jgi:hypothetical protein